MAQDPYRYFRPEARNLLDQFAQGILELEKTGSGAGAVQRLLRLAHTLKGAARVVRQSAIAERAHAIEDALAPFRDGADGISRDTIDAILAHLDAISSDIATLVAAADATASDVPAAEAPAATPAAAAADMPRVIRTDMADMDAVLDGVTETHARLNQLRRGAAAIEQIAHLADLLRAQVLAPAAASLGERAGGAAIRATGIADDLRRKIASLADNFDAGVAQLDRELRQLRDAAEALRLVAAENVLMALKRTARDSARALGRNVNLAGTGGDIRLDADVLGTVQSALIQIVRNAVAHGIETAPERIAAGKPPTGSIAVAVSRRGSKIVFECRDDGRGIDLAAVRKVAVERGLKRAEDGDLTAAELVRMLLHGGISTSASITDVAGRGVGLDVVREALEQLGGEVNVHIDPGCGTTFELVIPRSVTSISVLMVEAGHDGAAIALPLDGVRRIARLAEGEIAQAAAGASILHDGEAVPFIPLAAALDGTPWSARRAFTAIVVAGATGLAAIGVERLAGTAQIVIRPLPEHVHASPLVVGASLDGEGNPQLVLDPDALVAAATGVRRSAVTVAPARRQLLVVDDSLTTRMLEKSILESAGYDVEVASSGEEGLDLARRKPFALILCDVEMPGIDGFTFIERMRADVSLRDTPAILVTSRAAPEDRQRGREVGAHGYIIKSEFNQAELLDMIRPMVG